MFGAFSAALLLSALLAPWVGRAIDRYGGRPILVASSVVFALGLALLGAAQNFEIVVVAWLVLGVGMALGLYDAAFAALAGVFGHAAREPITGVTLMAGFASTIGWPTTALLSDGFGWRGACLAWAAMHLIIGLPLTLSLPSAAHVREKAGPDVPPPAASPWAMPLLAYVFSATWFVTASMAAHLPNLLIAFGAAPATAIAAAALVGPAQVAARIGEWTLLRRSHPLVSARLATLTHPIGALCLASFGPAAVWIFAVLHGTGNGILTIAKGTLPLAVFGPIGYGARNGLLSAPARLVQGLAPLLFGLVLERSPALALAVSSALSLSALAALFVFRDVASEAQSGKPRRFHSSSIPKR